MAEKNTEQESNTVSESSYQEVVIDNVLINNKLNFVIAELEELKVLVRKITG